MFFGLILFDTQAFIWPKRGKSYKTNVLKSETSGYNNNQASVWPCVTVRPAPPKSHLTVARVDGMAWILGAFSKAYDSYIIYQNYVYMIIEDK